MKYNVPEKKRIRVILDTDAKNEADDQFAIVHALLTPRFRVEGIIAAQFGERRTERSMMESYEEIKKILVYMDLEGKVPCLKGYTGKMCREEESEGVDFIVERALAEDSKLHIAVLGPLTNVAAAIRKKPEIQDKLHIVWIGGGTYPYGEEEFNLSNDIEAANYVFSSKAEVWQITRQAYYKMKVGFAELEAKVRPQGELGEYLCRQMIELNNSLEDEAVWPLGECWNICDLAATGLLIDEHEYFYQQIPAPYITQEMNYVKRPNNKTIRVYEKVDERFILEDFFAKLKLYEEEKR